MRKATTHRLCRYWPALLLALAGLTGCVSQKTGSEVDRDAALETYYQLAIGYLENGNRDSARHHITQAFELDKNSPHAYAARALLLQSEGEEERAEQNFKRALRYDPEFSQARNNYGAFLFQQERYEEAYRQFAKAAEDLDYGGRPRALLNKGRAALKLGRKDKAQAALEHAHNLDNELAPVMLELAHLYFEKEDYADAKRYLDRYAEYRRHNARSLLLGIKIERLFDNKDQEASYALSLKNRFPYSDEYLEYKREIKSN